MSDEDNKSNSLDSLQEIKHSDDDEDEENESDSEEINQNPKSINSSGKKSHNDSQKMPDNLNDVIKHNNNTQPLSSQQNNNTNNNNNLQQLSGGEGEDDYKNITDVNTLHQKIETLQKEKKQLLFTLAKQTKDMMDLKKNIKSLEEKKGEFENYFDVLMNKISKNSNCSDINVKMETSLQLIDTILNQNKTLSNKIIEYKQKVDQFEVMSPSLKSSPSSQKGTGMSMNSPRDYEVDSLKMRIKNYTAEITRLKKTNERIMEENSKINADIKFYKQIFEKTKKDHEQENNMITFALYDLALHYTMVKNEVNKQMKK